MTVVCHHRMLDRVVARMQSADGLHGVARCVIDELGGVRGVRTVAVVLCDADGAPTVWIGGGDGRAYLDGGYADDALFARLWATHAIVASADLWVAPLLGEDGVIGMVRVEVDPEIAATVGELGAIATYVSIRLALLGERRPALETLTPRQREVAELVVHGCTNHEIGRMLSISANAVKKHVSRVLAALDVSNRTELAAVAGRWRSPTAGDQDLPPTVPVVRRNPAKAIAAGCRRRVA